MTRINHFSEGKWSLLNQFQVFAGRLAGVVPECPDESYLRRESAFECNGVQRVLFGKTTGNQIPGMLYPQPVSPVGEGVVKHIVEIIGEVMRGNVRVGRHHGKIELGRKEWLPGKIITDHELNFRQVIFRKLWAVANAID